MTAALLALACALALAACGGGDSSTSTGASAQATASTGAEEAPSGWESPEAGGEGSSGGSESSEAEPEGSESSEEGEVSPNDRSAQFRTKGGDNSIQNFGDEGSSAEREEATKVIVGIFAAQKAKEWAKVCTLLSAKATGQLKLFAKRSPQLKGKGCAQVIALVLGSAPTSARPETIKGPVIALRRKGGESFALYKGSDGKAYAYPLILEKGQWKLIGMAPTPLNP